MSQTPYNTTLYCTVHTCRRSRSSSPSPQGGCASERCHTTPASASVSPTPPPAHLYPHPQCAWIPSPPSHPWHPQHMDERAHRQAWGGGHEPTPVSPSPAVGTVPLHCRTPLCARRAPSSHCTPRGRALTVGGRGSWSGRGWGEPAPPPEPRGMGGQRRRSPARGRALTETRGAGLAREGRTHRGTPWLSAPARSAAGWRWQTRTGWCLGCGCPGPARGRTRRETSRPPRPAPRSADDWGPPGACWSSWRAGQVCWVALLHLVAVWSFLTRILACCYCLLASKQSECLDISRNFSMNLISEVLVHWLVPILPEKEIWMKRLK